MSDSDQLHPVVLHHLVNTLGWPSLRPLQEQSIAPILGGEDTLVLAPTAGGKTEAAVFPLLTRMAQEQWSGVSVLYVCPLRALLNNLEPRLDTYAQWLGRRAALWHGDTTSGRRARLLTDPPDVLLTTPESLEAMLVSRRVDHARLFSGVRAIVVDEVHAFAGDDRGWHLLAVLERLQRLAGGPIQRIGLSATVGNPPELLAWLQGSTRKSRAGRVVAPEVLRPVSGPPPGDVTLDHVGSLENASKVISVLHAGEKRLVFCESRREVEELAHALHDRGVTTFVSHSSLSLDERRRAEVAFAEARDCVIVSTSTLELGIDVGDLDRVIQLNAPRTVASFLQRLGRTGRRPGTQRNALFLTTSEPGLLQAAGLLHLWSQGYVEPVTPPPSPRHIEAQQLLALTLQEGRIGRSVWREWWGELGLMGDSTTAIVEHLIHAGFLVDDNGMLHVGPETDDRFGHRHFMDLVSVFTAKPEFSVVHGRIDIGTVDPVVLTRRVEGPRVVVLAGRGWQVNYIDWKRRRCFVEPTETRSRMRWLGEGAPTSLALCRAQRAVLLGTDPDVALSRRATEGLERLRGDQGPTVSENGLVLETSDQDAWWWTWAGSRANATLKAAFPGVIDPTQQVGNLRLRLLGADVGRRLTESAATADLGSAKPAVTPAAALGLKFADVLPPGLAQETLAARIGDSAGALQTLAMPRVHRIGQR